MSHSLSKKFTFGSLLLFALPTTVMMVVMSLYTIVDGVFVSRFVSTNALSSVNIVYPVINIVLGISVMLSMGSNAIVAKKMGEGRPDSARETFTAIILLNIIIGLAFAIIGNLTAVPLSRMLGASDLLLEDCVTYLRWQLAFAPSLMLQIQFQMYFVTEGKPGIGLFLTLLAGIANAALDYVLIVPMRMGIAGAALATAHRLHHTGPNRPHLLCRRQTEPVVRTSPLRKKGAGRSLSQRLLRDGDEPFLRRHHLPVQSADDAFCR